MIVLRGVSKGVSGFYFLWYFPRVLQEVFGDISGNFRGFFGEALQERSRGFRRVSSALHRVRRSFPGGSGGLLERFCVYRWVRGGFRGFTGVFQRSRSLRGFLRVFSGLSVNFRGFSTGFRGVTGAFSEV